MSPTNSNGGAVEGPAAQTIDPASQPHDHDEGSPLHHAAGHSAVPRPRAGHPEAVELAHLLAGYPPAVVSAALLRLAGAHRVAVVLAADQVLATTTGPTHWHAGPYHRRVPLPASRELARHRYPPTGDRDLWVRYGPAGPPLQAFAPPALDSPRRGAA